VSSVAFGTISRDDYEEMIDAVHELMLRAIGRRYKLCMGRGNSRSQQEEIL